MIEDPKLIEYLLEHPDPIVAESCQVALNNMKNRAAEMAELRAKHEQQL